MIQRNSTPARTHARAGFTLLELVGVMVVIAILTAAVLPSTIDLIRVQRAVDEAAELPKVAEALKRGMLREQVFPINQNDASLLTDDSDAYCWWNLAARHGGGSANELRYPLGIRPGSDQTRKLYFAEANWGKDTLDYTLGNGVSFAAITGTGLDKLNPAPSLPATGWIDPADPHELRLLLLSTTNPDLPLPDSLSNNEFNKFWNDWAVGSDGDPMPNSDGDPMPNSETSTWSDYGLSAGDWQGRAAELNIERIDLRDWLCTVVIENRRAIVEASGTRFDNNNKLLPTNLGGDWESGSIYAYTENQNGAKIVLSTTEVTNGNTPPNVVSRIEAVTLSNRGRVTNETKAANIVVGGSKITTSGTPPVSASTPATATIQLTLTDRAPIDLHNPDPNGTDKALTGWTNADPSIQNRYFLKTQELLLGEPWTGQDVGSFIITEPFSSLRFDGLQWQY